MYNKSNSRNSRQPRNNNKRFIQQDPILIGKFSHTLSESAATTNSKKIILKLSTKNFPIPNSKIFLKNKIIGVADETFGTLDESYCSVVVDKEFRDKICELDMEDEFYCDRMLKRDVLLGVNNNSKGNSSNRSNSNRNNSDKFSNSNRNNNSNRFSNNSDRFNNSNKFSNNSNRNNSDRNLNSYSNNNSRYNSNNNDSRYNSNNSRFENRNNSRFDNKNSNNSKFNKNNKEEYKKKKHW